MIPDQLQNVLESTGYLLPERRSAHGVRTGADAQKQRRGQTFSPDAFWESQSSLQVYFKYVQDDVPSETIGTWRREIWNEGTSPLLWIVSPQRTTVYNAFGRPRARGDTESNRLETFENVASGLERLDSFGGQLAMETGQFSRNEPRVNRKTGVSHQLLSDLGALERDLVSDGLPRNEAQGLIGRCIFTQYLIDRRIVDPDLLQEVCGQPSLPLALGDPAATQSLFAWLSQTFNGDVFPMRSAEASLAGPHLERVAQFLRGSDPSSGRQSIFPYQFDVIPVELIGSIYEQFAHAGGDVNATRTDWTGNCHTRPSPVSLVLDEVMREAKGSESVLDIACGSGVFLVNTLPQLVRLRSKGAEPTREIVRSTLYEQVVGVDSDETAVRVAAFTLYLAALELDPDPTSPDALRFKPLIGTSLFVGDAMRIAADYKRPQGMTGSDGRARKFDVIVGTSPSDFKGNTRTQARQPLETPAVTSSAHGDGLDFVSEARKFAHQETRFGLILSALAFFSGSESVQNASHRLLQSLAPATLVNLSNLRSWLFPNTKMPAVALFAGQRPEQHRDQLTVVQVPWSEAGERTHTFELAPADVLKVSLSSLQDHPELLKAAAFGRHHDLLLLDQLKNRHSTLQEQFDLLGSKLSQGPEFGMPRPRETNRRLSLGVEPYLTLAEGPQLVASVSGRDTVFTGDHFGATLPRAHSASAHLLAAILKSALAPWFLLMTSPTLGLWISRLFVSDLNCFPVPDLRSAVDSESGRRVLGIAISLQERVPTASEWNKLDEAVFDLYDLDETERVVVRDGLARTSWLWQQGQRDSAAPAGGEDLRSYARAFLETMDAWFSARNVRRMRAEIFELPASASLRVIRFVLEERPGPSILETLPVEGSLATVLKQIGERLNVRIADSIASNQELRVHGPNEVAIIKPSARRHWMGVRALEDANAVVAKSFSGEGTRQVQMPHLTPTSSAPRSTVAPTSPPQS